MTKLKGSKKLEPQKHRTYNDVMGKVYNPYKSYDKKTK